MLGRRAVFQQRSGEWFNHWFSSPKNDGLMEIEEDTSQNPRTPRVHPWCQDFCAEMELLDMTNKKRGLSWVIGGLIASSASLMGIASHISRPEVDRIFLVDCFLGKCQNSVSTPWNIQTRWLCFFFGKVLEMVNVLSEICMTGRVCGFPMISDDFCQLHWFLATFFWRVSICFYAQHRDANSGLVWWEVRTRVT